jgi:hypothetical protein
MANTYRRRGLTGGASGALDALDGANLANGDVAIVYDPTTDGTYVYNLDSASGATEDSPAVISPNANAGTKRWVLTQAVCTEQTVTGMAGSGTYVVTVNADGKLIRSSSTIGTIIGDDTKLISGGSVAWTSGYTYSVAKAEYMIAGESYSFAGGSVTLDAAHATLNRIDVIVLTVSGTVTKITGTPADDPQQPYVNPQSYVACTWVYVTAASSAGATETTIYKENAEGEWGLTLYPAESVFNVASTTDKHAGTKSIEGTDIPVGAYIIAAKTGEAIDMGTQDALVLYIKLKSAWTTALYIKTGWFLDDVWIGNPVYISNLYGLDLSDITTWQQIVIPISSFQCGLPVNKLALYFEAGGDDGCFIDDIVLQAGFGNTSSAHQSLRPRGEWSATTVYLLNDTVTYMGNSYYCMYPCYGTDFPMAATNYWALLSEGGLQGPATNADNIVPRFDGADSNTLQTSLVSIDDDGTVNIPSGQTYDIDGVPHTHGGTGYGGVGLSFEATAKPTTSGIYHMILPYDMTIPADFDGSGFYNATNPSAQVVITIQKNGSNIGTCTVSTGGVATWDCSETAFVSGDIVTFVFPAQDSTWAGVVITLRGVRA